MGFFLQGILEIKMFNLEFWSYLSCLKTTTYVLRIMQITQIQRLALEVKIVHTLSVEQVDGCLFRKKIHYVVLWLIHVLKGNADQYAIAVISCER